MGSTSAFYSRRSSSRTKSPCVCAEKVFEKINSDYTESGSQHLLVCLGWKECPLLSFVWLLYMTDELNVNSLSIGSNLEYVRFVHAISKYE